MRAGGSAVTNLWLASAFSSASTWVMQVGLFIDVLRAAPVSTLALVELIGTVPALLIMPVAGTIADRLDPRGLAIGSMLAQTGCVAGMALLLRTDLWLVAALYGAQGVSNAVWPPSRQQWLYQRVRPQDRNGANAAIGSVVGVTTIIGAVSGGVLSAWSPLAALIVAAALQFLAVLPLLPLARVPLPSISGSAHQAGASLRAQFAVGVRALRGLPLARSIVWLGIAWGCIGGASTVLLAGHVTKDLHGSANLLGGVYAVDGAAVIAGTVLAGRIARRHHLLVYALAYVVQGIAWTAVFLAGQPATVALAVAVMRLASGVIIALDTTILLHTVPAGLRGRVSSLHMTTYSAMARVALALDGVLLTVVDTRLLGVIAGLASVAVGLLWWWRRDPASRHVYLATTGA